MVSMRCKMAVEETLTQLGLHYTIVELGEADIKETISPKKYLQVKTALQKTGLELMNDKKDILVQKIKNVIIDLVHYSGEPITINFSLYLSQKLHYDYTYLANVFSEVQGSTIEKFFIAQKIECVKELLVYNEFTLTEIAYKLNYSSLAHLSGQFKKVTGITPTQFKQSRNKKRSMLEDL